MMNQKHHPVITLPVMESTRTRRIDSGRMPHHAILTRSLLLTSKPGRAGWHPHESSGRGDEMAPTTWR